MESRQDPRTDNETLMAFWENALTLSEDEKKEILASGEGDWKDLAPSEKLFQAAASLGTCRHVLDYGCGHGWAGIIAAKCGCAHVTAVDVVPGSIAGARLYASKYGAEPELLHVSPDWLRTVPEGTYDGIICSNVLDVVPEDTARTILEGLWHAARAEARIVIGLNYWLDPQIARERGMDLQENRLYVDGVLRLVTRRDEEWTELFRPWFTVRKMDHFAWPGEETERRRLFELTKNVV